MTNWSHIVQEHGAIVWRTVHRLLGNEADEEDCFQRTFLSATGSVKERSNPKLAAFAQTGSNRAGTRMSTGPIQGQ